MNTNIKNHLKALIQLSIIDRDFGDREKTFLYIIGKANKIPEVEIDVLVEQTISEKPEAEITYQGLMSEERFDYLYDIIQLMKIDGDVYLTEIRFCESIAEKLGYQKKVVKKLSALVYSDPSVKANRDLLLKTANKYLK